MSLNKIGLGMFLKCLLNCIPELFCQVDEDKQRVPIEADNHAAPGKRSTMKSLCPTCVRT